jgi:hypothetical protein
VLLPDDGGRPPKHVGGKIICIRTICFVCAISWFFNKKYGLHGINYIKKFQAICNYAGIYIIRCSICKTHKTSCALHELHIPALFQAVSEWSQCVQSFRACLTKRQTEWDRRRPPSHIKHANSPKEALRPSQALKNWITCVPTASHDSSKPRIKVTQPTCIASCCLVIGSDSCHPWITWLITDYL